MGNVESYVLSNLGFWVNSSWLVAADYSLRPPAILWGAPGCAKSALTQQVAASLGGTTRTGTHAPGKGEKYRHIEDPTHLGGVGPEARMACGRPGERYGPGFYAV